MHNLEVLLDQVRADGARVLLVPFRSAPRNGYPRPVQRWADRNESTHVNSPFNGGLYGRKWKSGCTACFTPYFAGSPGGCLGPDCLPENHRLIQVLRLRTGRQRDRFGKVLLLEQPDPALRGK